MFLRVDLWICWNGPVGSNHGSLARARARGAGSHTDRRTTAACPRALSDPEDKGHGVGREGGGGGRLNDTDGEEVKEK